MVYVNVRIKRDEIEEGERASGRYEERKGRIRWIVSEKKRNECAN